MIEKIRADLKGAMRAKDQVRVDTLRGALAAFTNELVAKGKKPTDELTDDEQLAVLKRLAKQRNDSIEQFTNGGRAEMAAKEATELEIIKAYLPQAASREEIEKVAKAKIAEMGADGPAAIGKLTGAIMKEFGGRADGGDVKEVLQRLLS
ncbi:GatB/YqeY domain-containing protein [Candidatus Kaiserbacteria bacterium]|nr:GatB/YqeY domain-containing protein [Candidatus Kaiserbacteria bacterium]